MVPEFSLEEQQLWVSSIQIPPAHLEQLFIVFVAYQSFAL